MVQVPSPRIGDFYLTFRLQSMFHLGEEMKTVLHRLDVSLMPLQLLLPEISLHDHGRLGNLLKLTSIVPLSDQVSVPLLNDHDFVEHLLDLPDAYRSEVPPLSLVSPPLLKALRSSVLLQICQYLVLFLKNISL